MIDSQDLNVMQARVRVRRRIEINGQAIEKEVEFEGQMTPAFVAGLMDNVLRSQEQKPE